MFFFREINRYLRNAFKYMKSDTQQIHFQSLDSQDSFNDLLEQSEHEPVLLFKHSTMCGISSMAQRRLKQLHETGDPPVYKLVIQETRSLSNEIAQHFGIRHESPQVILVYKGMPVYDTSHSAINPATVREASSIALTS